MNADEIMRALKSNAEVNPHAAVMMMAADLIETLQAELANLQKELAALAIESVKRDIGLAKLEAEVMQLWEAQRWIPVDEKSDDLPHDDGGQREVMCYFADGVMESLNIYRIRDWNERRRKIGANDLITHFMPLPAAPEEGE